MKQTFIKSAIVAGALGGVMLLAGCATPTTEGFRQTLNAFIGAPEADFIHVAGIPTRTYEVDGFRYLEYEDRQTHTTPGTAPNYRTHCTGYGSSRTCNTRAYGGSSPITRTHHCDVTFRVHNGIIVDYNFVGKDCKAVPEE